MDRAKIYAAMMMAADQIGNHPKTHDFMNGMREDVEGPDPHGCALAWIGHFLDFPGGSAYYFSDVAREVFGLSEFMLHEEFYGSYSEEHRSRIEVPAEIVAENLRRYAEEHFN